MPVKYDYLIFLHAAAMFLLARGIYRPGERGERLLAFNDLRPFALSMSACGMMSLFFMSYPEISWLRHALIPAYVLSFASLLLYSLKKISVRFSWAALLYGAAVFIFFLFSRRSPWTLSSLCLVLAFPASLAASYALYRDEGAKSGGGKATAMIPSAAMAVYAFTWLFRGIKNGPDFTLQVLNADGGISGLAVIILQALAAAVIALWFILYKENRRELPTAGAEKKIISAALIIILAAGWIVAAEKGASTDRDLRDRILRQAKSMANALNPEILMNLKFSSEDINNPYFRLIREQMIAFGRYSGIKYIYSLVLDGSNLVFGPENIPEKDTMASPPGTVYIRPHRAFINVFRDAQPGVIGPYTDEYGTFVSGYAPVIDSHTGRAIMVVAIDVESSAWCREIARERLKIISAVFVIILLILSADLLIIFRDIRWNRKDRFIFRQMETHLVLVAGFIFSALIFLFFNNLELRKESESLMISSDSIAGIIIESLTDINYDLIDLAKFFKNSDDITWKEFRSFVTEMRISPVTAMGWFPSAGNSGEPRFAESLRQHAMNRMGTYSLDYSGVEIPCGAEGTGYPLRYSVSSYIDDRLPAFSFTSPGRWRSAVNVSLKTGMPALVESSEMEDGDKERRIITIVSPVVKEEGRKPAGFVSLSADLQLLLSNVMSLGKSENIKLNCDIIDITYPGGVEILGGYTRGNGDKPGISTAPVYENSGMIYPLFVFDRSLCIKIYKPENAIKAFVTGPGVMGGVSAFMLSLALALLSGYAREREFTLEAIVKNRTKELGESEERFRILYEASFGGIAVHDNGIIIECNSGLAAMTGYTIDELTGMDGLLLIAPDCRSYVRGKIESGAEVKYDSSGIKKDGSLYPIEIHGKTIPYHGKRVRVTEFRDITDRKEIEYILNQQRNELEAVNEEMRAGMEEFEAINAELIETNQRLLESEEKFSRAFSINPAMMSISSIDSGVFIEVNETFLHSFGLTKDMVIGKTIYELDLFEDTAQRDLVLDFIRKDGFVRNIEVALNIAGGEKRLGLYSADYIIINDKKYMLSVVTDITERKRMQEALEFSEKKYRLLFETSVDTIWICDNGVIIDCNTRAENMFHCSRDDIIGKTPEDFSPEYQQEGTRSAEEADKKMAAAYGGEPQFFEWMHCTLDGTAFEAEVSLSCFEIDEKKLIISIIRDVSEKKRIESRLAHMQKMDAIGQLAGGVAHDFNNQLSGILGYAELLSTRLADSSLKRYADGIISVALRSSDLTKKLLAFARKGQFQLVNVNVHSLIDETIEMLMHSIDKRISIVKKYNAGSYMVTGDTAQLQNAFLNLGLNARDAMRDGGTLTFETEDIRLGGEMHRTNVMDVCEGEYIVISITDTGCGMTDSVKSHLFEPFFTTKEAGKGTGMGLASVYGTMKNHNGTINVYSEPGQGTTFRIYLPLDSNNTGQIHKTAAEEAHDIPRQNILIIDDEDVVRSVLAEMLRDMGHTVYEAVNGIGGVSLYRERWADIDIVIIDMIMPEMNGRDAFLEMKKINPAVRVILSSGFSMDTESQSMMSEGVKGFIHKPYRKSRLIEIINEVLRDG